MFRFIAVGAVLALSAPASAATFANFDTSIEVYLSATPAQELYEEGGYAPSPGTIIEEGDVSLTLGDDGNGDACCMGGFWAGPGPTLMGEIALSAEGAVNSVGTVHASGNRLGLWRFGNYGNVTETVTIGFDIAMAITQAIDPLVGGVAESGTSVTIERDGTVIYSESLYSLIEEFALGASISDYFEYSFDLAPTNGISTEFDITIGGLVNVTTDVAPVPLPAGAVLLLSGFGALVLRRRIAG